MELNINQISPSPCTRQISLGDKVRVIDFAETPSECAVFQIASIENNRLALTTLDKQTTYEPFWVKRQDVRLVDSDHI